MSTQSVDQSHSDASSRGEPFTEVEFSQFQRDGFVIVRGLADAPLRAAMLRIAHADLAGPVDPVEFEADIQYSGSPQSRTSEGGGTVRRLLQAHTRGSVFTDWISYPPLVGRLQQILGPRVVMPLAHHNCIMTKQPRFSSQTCWHQDIRYWSFQRPELVSVWLALGSETLENGCLSLIPQTHAMEFSRDRFDEALFFRPDVPENRALIEKQVTAELQPGDVLFFHCRALHAAGHNQTDQPKFSVVFTFRPEDNRPLPGTRSASRPEMLLPT